VVSGGFFFFLNDTRDAEEEEILREWNAYLPKKLKEVVRLAFLTWLADVIIVRHLRIEFHVKAILYFFLLLDFPGFGPSGYAANLFDMQLKLCKDFVSLLPNSFYVTDTGDVVILPFGLFYPPDGVDLFVGLYMLTLLILIFVNARGHEPWLVNAGWLFMAVNCLQMGLWTHPLLLIVFSFYRRLVNSPRHLFHPFLFAICFLHLHQLLYLLIAIQGALNLFRYIRFRLLYT